MSDTQTVDTDAIDKAADELAAEVKDAEEKTEKKDKPTDIVFDKCKAIRRCSVIRLNEMLGEGEGLYIREWPTETLFGMVATIQKVTDGLMNSGLFTTTEELEAKASALVATGTEEDEAIATVQQSRNVVMMQAVMKLIAESQADVYQVIMASAFIDQECSKPVDEDVIKQMPIGDTVTILKGIWHVNWNMGSLGNVLDVGLIAKFKEKVSKTKPKDH